MLPSLVTEEASDAYREWEPIVLQCDGSILMPNEKNFLSKIFHITSDTPVKTAKAIIMTAGVIPIDNNAKFDVLEQFLKETERDLLEGREIEHEEYAFGGYYITETYTTPEAYCEFFDTYDCPYKEGVAYNLHKRDVNPEKTFRNFMTSIGQMEDNTKLEICIVRTDGLTKLIPFMKANGERFPYEEIKPYIDDAEKRLLKNIFENSTRRLDWTFNPSEYMSPAKSLSPTQKRALEKAGRDRTASPEKGMDK